MNNSDQIDYWNGPAGQRWVEHSDRLDAMLAPFADRVLAQANAMRDEQIIDIGCGAGALTLLATQAAGDGASALGVDVSLPLLALARQRAQASGSTARFEHGDASQFDAPGQFDLMISRFGVMFFEQPAAAFASLRKTIKPGGRLAFICWQALAKNDWAFAPLQAALPFFDSPPEPGDPNAPGPFAFQDRDRLAALLDEAGWKAVGIDPVETEMTLPGDTLEESAAFMMQLGPLSRLLAAQEIDSRPVEAALQELMRQHQKGDGRIRMKSACWLVSASQ